LRRNCPPDKSLISGDNIHPETAVSLRKTQKCRQIGQYKERANCLIRVQISSELGRWLTSLVQLFRSLRRSCYRNSVNKAATIQNA
jgi:hypothetical protein